MQPGSVRRGRPGVAVRGIGQDDTVGSGRGSFHPRLGAQGECGALTVRRNEAKRSKDGGAQYPVMRSPVTSAGVRVS